eukprot:NODE_827_length_3663_cov_1.497755.p2 type:complete len:359 gc:universal NODE_827_length_3663_cov_1.497755:998-2074(+)
MIQFVQNKFSPETKLRLMTTVHEPENALQNQKLAFNTQIKEAPSFKRLFMAISCRLPNENEWALLHLMACQEYPSGLVPPFIGRLVSLGIDLLKDVCTSNPLFAPNTSHILLYCMVCLHNLAVSNGSAVLSIPEIFDLVDGVLDLNSDFKDSMHVKKLGFQIVQSMANSRWIPTGKQVWVYKKLCFYIVHDDRFFIKEAARMLSTMIKMNPHKEKQIVYDEVLKYSERLVQLIVPRGYDVEQTEDFIDHALNDIPMVEDVLELLFYTCFHSDVLVETLYEHPRDVVSILIYYTGHPTHSNQVQGVSMYAALILNIIFKRFDAFDLGVIYRNIQVHSNKDWWMKWYKSLILEKPSIPRQ